MVCLRKSISSRMTRSDFLIFMDKPSLDNFHRIKSIWCCKSLLINAPIKISSRYTIAFDKLRECMHSPNWSSQKIWPDHIRESRFNVRHQVVIRFKFVVQSHYNPHKFSTYRWVFWYKLWARPIHYLPPQVLRFYLLLACLIPTISTTSLFTGNGKCLDSK